MNTPEGHVKACVKKLLKRYIDEGYVYAHWPVQAGYGAPTLDCNGSCRGRSFAIETKAPGEKLTPRQELTKQQMEAAGIKVFVIGQQKYEGWDLVAGSYPYSGMADLDAWLLLT